MPTYNWRRARVRAITNVPYVIFIRERTRSGPFSRAFSRLDSHRIVSLFSVRALNVQTFVSTISRFRFVYAAHPAYSRCELRFTLRRIVRVIRAKRGLCTANFCFSTYREFINYHCGVALIVSRKRLYFSSRAVGEEGGQGERRTCLPLQRAR